MKTGRPSRTAYSAARYRAAHQVLDGGAIFADPLAVRIVGEEPETGEEPGRRGQRLFIAARSRFAEDALAAAVVRGARRVVILGAGLDTFAYRNPYPGLEVVEVDHPDTQAWKRRRLREAGIEVPPTVTYVPVDLEKDTFVAGPGAFVMWLGVVPYLTRGAFEETLGGVSEVVFDYAMPTASMSRERRTALEARAARAARVGEPWRSSFQPDELAALLRERGFGEIEDLGPAELAERYFGRPGVPKDTPGGHLLHARKA
ncbi:class I SAM-dependent methyltransferase [Pseudosporangium ferrugineum]|uniref:S-adenosyl-L-methionine-dependent methyltransferase n=1 Tax=Pseudosporangium ferrugineum TaxID=439699 RepID=A0A2T0RMM1_9ACTN|nr:SAM-dependent methyltransferase [Pseudosporangium ferrugineum]PRY22408.1 methyltransferase (TIGR00027 family) [Pseudosporangium ferrugineum]